MGKGVTKWENVVDLKCFEPPIKTGLTFLRSTLEGRIIFVPHCNTAKTYVLHIQICCAPPPPILHG